MVSALMTRTAVRAAVRPAALRTTTRLMSTGKKAEPTYTGLLVGSFVFWAGTFAYAFQTHAFDAYLQGDVFHKEKARRQGGN